MVIENGMVLAACAFAGLVLTIGGLIGRYERRSTTTDKCAADALELARKNAMAIGELRELVAKSVKELADEDERVRREVGGTIEAIRKKIQEFEIWARDEFLRKKSFEAIQARAEAAQEARDARLEARLVRIDQKLDAALITAANAAVAAGAGQHQAQG